MDSLPDIRQNEEVKEELNVFGFYLFQTGRHLAGRQLKAWRLTLAVQWISRKPLSTMMTHRLYAYSPIDILTGFHGPSDRRIHGSLNFQVQSLFDLKE